MRPESNKYQPPTVKQLSNDAIMELAAKYWSPATKNDHKPFDPEVIEDIYFDYLFNISSSLRPVMILEFSQYLEQYLWPNFTSGSTQAHLLSIVILINEKFRERINAWSRIEQDPAKFTQLFRKVLTSLLLGFEHISLKQQTILLIFLNHCFNSMEIEICREQIKKLVSLSMWSSLQPHRRNFEFGRHKKWFKYWKMLQKKEEQQKKQLTDGVDTSGFERKFLHSLIAKFFEILDAIPEKTTESTTESGVIVSEHIKYCERFLELLIDLEALLPTRRFFNTLMDDCHLVLRCQLSNLVKRADGHLFRQLLDMLKFYSKFEICDETGDPLTDKEVSLQHYEKIVNLQKIVFRRFPQLRTFALSNISRFDNRKNLLKYFKQLNYDEIRELCVKLNLVPDKESEQDYPMFRLDEEFLIELLIANNERRISQLIELNEMPLYPTETIIWNENVVPTAFFSGDDCLALPKLNLQFLTLHDYLLRNFNLFRLESTYEIRQDIEDSIRRLCPMKNQLDEIEWCGWSRMILPISKLAIVDVKKPRIGETCPSKVRANISVILPKRNDIRMEWDGLRKHDVCFLLSVRPQKYIGEKYDKKKPFRDEYGAIVVRGCEVEGLLDVNGRIIEDFVDKEPLLKGNRRTFRVLLDCNQYRDDMNAMKDGAEDVYGSFNLVLRRKPKENNFKAVLETIRDLMNTECVVPEWIHDILLGYGDPSAANYKNMTSTPVQTLDFVDTFLNFEHIRESFTNYDVELVEDGSKAGENKPERPFRLTFNESERKISVEAYQIAKRGPYLFNEPKKNSIKFTPTQIEAIRSGMQPGLTIVVGPPGTGKTDVAVQIISNIYHNNPNQRTLIVTHSNQALNQLFEKIINLDVDERHLLRLGHGEESLETEKDFSRYGRVNYVLAKRIHLLEKVDRLKDSLDVQSGDVGYTCETARYFFVYHVRERWRKFLDSFAENVLEASLDFVQINFPFRKFFDDAPQPLFKCCDLGEDLEIAKSCFRYIEHIFEELEEFGAFEMLRTGLDRLNYLLVKEAKIIAMTCTHAALKRKELVSMGFKYDNILMEEAAQILEIETFIPLLLQNPDDESDGHNRLKRWIMIGDHHQLPPVIKNMAFQKYSNMEQSLFTRLIRLGVPAVELDAQGRAKSSICRLYNWRYANLGDLEHVRQLDEYRLANAGFLYEFQLIDVQDLDGVGESEPEPYFYQNMAEAEYIVAVYMFMRLIGYPAEKISILTTYNGQKQLIRNIIEAHCSTNPMFGDPYKITTVDKYQGQQNDFILLSLVRSKAVGHLRDVRRLIVAMSRARLGLYIFGRVGLFENCLELTPAFDILKSKPNRLALLLNETYPSKRYQDSDQGHNQNDVLIVKNVVQMRKFVSEMYNKEIETHRNQSEASATPSQPPSTSPTPDS